MTSTAHDAAFAGRRRTFKLPIGAIGELERLCQAGIGEIALRLGTHRFYLADIRETVRLGLEGGGASEPEATALVMRYLDEGPLDQHLELAAAIIAAALSGVKPGKPEPEGGNTSPATSPDYTAPPAE